jgi:hypothetical protein
VHEGFRHNVPDLHMQYNVLRIKGCLGC